MEQWDLLERPGFSRIRERAGQPQKQPVVTDSDKLRWNGGRESFNEARQKILSRWTALKYKKARSLKLL